ncbi:MAG: DUF2225 domain-containing protein [Roseburia sp.]|nr:DUF2225 domain-containing protein [Roseburia sp.]MCM1098957.1 DUF2225 domain-containing protein [Ruminococcus flavefaciens]
MGLLSGLRNLGLGGLEGMNIFEEEEKKVKEAAAAPPPKVEEKDLIYDKSFPCPVCESEFSAKIMKSGKAKLIGTDMDLRAKYDGIDAVKYDVLLCDKCGYAALSRYFKSIVPAQAKLIKENISPGVHIKEYADETYGYEQAFERYQLALACAVVKKSRASERAYICLKSAWLLRGWRESLQEKGGEDANLVKELEEQENEYLQNAFKGFMEARKAESFPMCGMDEVTVDYLLAVLAARFKQYDAAGRMISSILTDTAANARIKDKARDLKDQIQAERKKSGE